MQNLKCVGFELRLGFYEFIVPIENQVKRSDINSRLYCWSSSRCYRKFFYDNDNMHPKSDYKTAGELTFLVF